jgi:hypothetical protein
LYETASTLTPGDAAGDRADPSDAEKTELVDRPDDDSVGAPLLPVTGASVVESGPDGMVGVDGSEVEEVGFAALLGAAAHEKIISLLHSSIWTPHEVLEAGGGVNETADVKNEWALMNGEGGWGWGWGVVGGWRAAGRQLGSSRPARRVFVFFQAF